jgi:hypothetical protein
MPGSSSSWDPAGRRDEAHATGAAAVEALKDVDPETGTEAQRWLEQQR